VLPHCQELRLSPHLLLTTVCSFSLLAIALLPISQAVKVHRYNRCVHAQIPLRQNSALQGQSWPGKLIDLTAVQYCHGF
jgi:hypothetical protein